MSSNEAGNVIVDRRPAPMTGLKWEELVQSLVPLSRPHRLLAAGTDDCNEWLVSEDAAWPVWRLNRRCPDDV